MNIPSLPRLVLVSLALLSATAFAADPLPVAVFDFQGGDRSLEKAGLEVGLLLNVRLSASGDLFLVERQEVEKLLGEQEFGISGAISPDTAARVGALVGAKVLVTGRIFQSGEKTYLVAKLIGTDTGRVFSEMTTTASLDDLDTPVGVLADKIAATIGKQADTFVARVETMPARIERLKRAVAGKTLPPVLVTIPEQHLARPVIDPAAQTELMVLLAAVGFEVLAPDRGTDRADAVRVTGEAFSELGLRRGNLVSCRARIEVVAKDAAGRLIGADRQMDVAVDIAEHVAGKKALENAALKLADRLVPKLAR